MTKLTNNLSGNINIPDILPNRLMDCQGEYVCKKTVVDFRVKE